MQLARTLEQSISLNALVLDLVIRLHQYRLFLKMANKQKLPLHSTLPMFMSWHCSTKQNTNDICS